MRVQMYMRPKADVPMQMPDHAKLQTIIMRFEEAVLVFVLGDSAGDFIVTSDGDYVLMGG